ncbi:MAG: ribose 5-phosphate isomerase B [Deltaproteobacteria bacterium]|nr:ribose 5-phosphate isomerase B [Deltaproteobacteria bacterium]
MATQEDIYELIRQEVDRALGGAAESTGASSRQGHGSGAASPSGSSASQVAPGGVGDSIAIGSDHGGFGLKEKLMAHLRAAGVSVTDCGTFSTDACDYPDFAHEVARRVGEGLCRWGVIVDGAGIGSAMTANKVPGVRAALCYDLSSARNSREHNHANVLTLGAGLIGESLAKQILDTWLATPWGPDRHARRVDKITEVESRYLRR